MTYEKSDADMEADILTVMDRGESLGLIEPLVVNSQSRHWGKLNDLALELATQSAAFKSSLPQGLVDSVADLVRSMNCYYSNLIEGHDTHPIEIERALNNDYSQDPRKRDLQLEAKAHITVQAWIDGGGLRGGATSEAGLRDIHQRFCERLPPELLWVEMPGSSEKHLVIPGQFRKREVQVGQHIAVSAGAVPRFLERFAQGYAHLGKAETIVAIAAAHHRLLWIHPFLDGNGRVARLMTHAMLLEHLDTGALWSAARGLARSEGQYKSHLAACDLKRRNDLDGRGHLSEETLAKFTQFFLETCLDQVQFMRQLLEPDRLRLRILNWAKTETDIGALPPKSGHILEVLLYRGELPRSEVGTLLNVTDRHARRLTSELLKTKILTSKSDRSPLRLALSFEHAQHWLPGIFP